MNKTQKIIFLLLTIGLTVIFFLRYEVVYKDYFAAKAFLKSKGYTIVGYEGIVYDDTVSKDQLLEKEYYKPSYAWQRMAWQLQKGKNPAVYIGKRQKIHFFLISNSPLVQKYKKDYDLRGRIGVYVMTIDHKVVGAFCQPTATTGLFWLTLDGKNIDQLYDITFTFTDKYKQEHEEFEKQWDNMINHSKK